MISHPSKANSQTIYEKLLLTLRTPAASHSVYKQIVKEIIRASFSTPKLILFLISLNVNNINPKLAIIIPAHPATETLSCRKNNEKIVINIGEHPLEIGYT